MKRSFYCWYNREEDDWEVLEPETENEDELSAEKYYRHPFEGCWLK